MDYQTLTSRFASPDAAYRPMLFWIWNGDVTREGIDEQLADFAAKGAGGVFLHPMGENFRLADFIQGINPPYLSDEYFDLVRYAAKQARALGLYLWLYDEGGWPSGSAQGKVVEGHPELAGKRLHVHRLRTPDPALPANTIAAVGLPEMGVPQPLDLREAAQGLWPHEEILAFTLEPDGYAIDILSAAAVQRFIEVTHERYATAVGEFFGNTIPGIFTDETSLGGVAGSAAVPWTRDLLEGLTTQMGRDARIYLPLLFSPDAVGADVFNRYSEHEIVAARCDYYEVLTRRFGDAYWRQITNWCAEHGLIHTGHVGGEDNLPDNLSFGHFFRTAGVLHAPGVDAIWRQIFPGQDNFAFPRLAQSSLHQQDAVGCACQRPEVAPEWERLAITETNAVYGFGFHYEQMRWVADYHFQGGINLYGPMATHYTCQGGRLYCTLSHLGPGNPLWPSYKPFAEYIGRMCTVVRHSEEHPAVAIYYPIEALWTIEGVGEAWRSLKDTSQILGNLQINFDFLNPDLLEHLEAQAGAAVADGLSYRLLIVPATLAMTGPHLAKLQQLAAAGVPVLFLEHWPVQAADMGGRALFEQALAKLQASGGKPLDGAALEEQLDRRHVVDPWLKLADPAPALLMAARELDDGRLYVLTNDSDAVLEPFLVARTPQPMVLEAWSPRDGEIVPLLQTQAKEAAELRPVLAPWSSLILVLRPASEHEAAVQEKAETAQERQFALWLADPRRRLHHVPHADVLAEYMEAADVRIVDEYVIREGSVQVIVGGEPEHPFVEGPAELLLWQDWGIAEFSGHIEYSFDLTVSPHFVRRPLLLDLGNVFWTAAVWVNDEFVAESIWHPYTIDLTGHVRAGANRLRVVVGNTLANQACQESVLVEARERGWCNPYVQRVVPMMREDLRSGLVGPVRIIVGLLQPD